MNLIDADELKEKICNNVYPVSDSFNNTDYGMFWTGGIEKIIDEQPTIDAVPVIRCKDCVHFKLSKVLGNTCALTDNHVTRNDFCSKAERKEE